MQTESDQDVLTDLGAIGHDIVQGWLLLLLAKRPRHGYDLVDALRSHGIKMADHSYVYRLLRKLDQVGVLRSEWDLPGHGGTARRVYHLNAAGLVALDQYAQAIALLSGQLQEYGDGYDDLRRSEVRAIDL